jgi:DNA-binding NarL/FixJ family response regulator
MCTQLCIQVSSSSQSKKLELNLLFNEEWTADAEATLIHRLQEVLYVVRAGARGLRLSLDLDVDDPDSVMFLLKKKLNTTSSNKGGQPQKLTVREIEILGLIMVGFTNTEIAKKLFISFETVRSHRKSIITKTGVRNTAALINYYHQTFFEK